MALLVHERTEARFVDIFGIGGFELTSALHWESVFTSSHIHFRPLVGVYSLLTDFCDGDDVRIGKPGFFLRAILVGRKQTKGRKALRFWWVTCLPHFGILTFASMAW